MDTPIENKCNMLMRLSHHSMAMVGGFMGGYAVLTRADFLGNAQTANLVYLVFAIVGRNAYEVALRVGAFVLYFLGAMCFVFVKNKTSFSVRYTALLIDALAILILGCMPADINVILGLYPIFFAMSFQWNSFPGAYGYVSSSIFSTNNTRQVALSVAEYLTGGSRAHLHKAGFFLGSLVCFHIGVLAAFLTTEAFSVRSIFCNYGFLAIGCVLAVLVEREERAKVIP